LAQVIAAERLGDAGALQALTGGAAALAPFAPERVAEATGVDPDRVRALARAFASQRPSLAIGGGLAAAQTNGLFNLQAIYGLNYLVGSVGVEGGVRFNSSPALPGVGAGDASAFTDWQAFAERLRGGPPVSALLVHDA